ncbi:hypothetical protein WH50_14820 [Pokkaliibacter plantistimulans]|uniref:histidine kinase n=1 Tax=Pokkaliibacter plantistimulans TaxID=1635171 RepID=A0ABX5LYE3_9GAMM|nr:sensor histidine kinase [Pokkaliibacter plantistimulans]PXF30503.1 hypothetical protein WH50_14820 [Pokkaliibacter plantistimulans]
MKSLRSRLMISILLPVFLAAAILLWIRYQLEMESASEQFDKTLIALTMAVSRDLTNSEDGEALSLATSTLLREALGGNVFYHLTAVGGYYRAGYAYPPAVPKELVGQNDRLLLFNGTHHGAEVRVARLSERRTIAAPDDDSHTITGDVVTTVWQPIARRDSYVWGAMKQSLVAMALLILTMSLALGIAVKIALRPLTRLQKAIASRSAEDLSPFEHNVPHEVDELVTRLNTLFGQLSESMESRDRFISNAAHQLKNPIAGVLALAEATVNSRSDHERLIRSERLLTAGKELAHLSNQLLSLERARGFDQRLTFAPLELNELAEQVCQKMAERVLTAGVDFEFAPGADLLPVLGDGLLLGESLVNLINNALIHGGESNRLIRVATRRAYHCAEITVTDGGSGFAGAYLQAEAARTEQRFVVFDAEKGSGLGLSIVREIMRRHGGEMHLDPVPEGAQVRLLLPLIDAQTLMATEA